MPSLKVQLFSNLLIFKTMTKFLNVQKLDGVAPLI